MEKILVRGVKFPPGHIGCPPYDDIPGGPLVPIPGTVVALSMGGDGGFAAAGSQKYVGWTLVSTDEPVMRDGDVLTKPYRVRTNRGHVIRHEPVRCRWVYDPTPILVARTPEIIDAINKGDLELVTQEKSKQGKKSGGDA
jgi:hypothetical protein